MTPKIIHCFWEGGAKSPLAERCRASWARFAPGWEIREWSLAKLEALGIEPPSFVKRAVAERKWAFVADWARFVVLEREGGVYLDFDEELIGGLKPEMLDSEWCAGEDTPRGIVGYAPGAGLALEPASPVARAMLERYAAAAFDGRTTVGEIMGTLPAEILKRLKLLSPEVMSPVGIDGTLRRSDKTIGIHHYAMSWARADRKLLRWLSWHGFRPMIDCLLRLKRGARNPAGGTPIAAELPRPVRILFVWTGVTSYMADCWRRLMQSPDVELKVIVEDAVSGREFDRARVLRGLDGDVAGWRPDVIFAVGWRSQLVRKFVTASEYRRVPKVCCFDMPWRASLRCFAARWVLGRFLGHYSAAFVPGEAAARYARWLGFGRIHRGLFAIDVGRFAAAAAANREPRPRFVYLGRDSREKRLDLLRRAYDRYRELGGTWPLEICGGANFVAPEAVPALLARHAALLLASEFDPWPLVALEAKASGCEVIASDRCGNVGELALTGVRFGDVEAMATKMLELERRGGGATRGEAAAVAWNYDCGKWCERVIALTREVI